MYWILRTPKDNKPSRIFTEREIAEATAYLAVSLGYVTEAEVLGPDLKPIAHYSAKDKKP